MNETNDIVDKIDQKITGASPLWINDWYIDPDTCRIKRGNEVVKLEPKVMTVLVCLAGEAGKVISSGSQSLARYGGRLRLTGQHHHQITQSLWR